MGRSLIGNLFTEADIKKWLCDQGYRGRSAVIHEIELHAIKRPGWIQIFRFHVCVKSDDADGACATSELFGVLRDDERERSTAAKTKLWAFDSREKRDAKLAEVSVGMTTRRHGKEIEFRRFLDYIATWLGMKRDSKNKSSKSSS